MSFWWGRDSLMDSLYRWIAVFLLASLLAPSLAAQEDRASLLEREKALEAKFKELAGEHSLSDGRAQQALREHADVLFLLTEYKEALKRYETLQKAEFRSLPRDSETHVTTGLSIAQCHAVMGKDRKAKRAIKTLKKYCQKNFGRADRLRVVHNIAVNLHGMKLYEDAAETYQELQKSYEESDGPDHLNTLYAALGYTASLIELDRGEEIEKVAQEALERFEKHHPDDSGNYYFRNNISAYYVQCGRFQEAYEVLEPVIDKLDDQASLDFDFKLVMRENYVIALAAIDQQAKALPLIEEIITDLKKNPLRNREKIASLEELRDECKGIKPKGEVAPEQPETEGS